MSENKNKKASNGSGIVKLLIALILIVLAAGAAGVFLYMKLSPSTETVDLLSYYGLEENAEEGLARATDGELSIVFDDKIITDRALVLSGEEPYIRLGIITANIDERYYFDEQENAVAIRSENNFIYAYSGENTYYSNEEAVQTANPPVFNRDGTVYVSLEFLKTTSGIIYSVYDSPKRVVIKYLSGEFTYVTTNSDAYLRAAGGIKSPIVCKIIEGARLKVTSDAGGWYEVVSDDGYIGYIKTSEVSEKYTETVSFPDYMNVTPKNALSDEYWTDDGTFKHYSEAGYTSSLGIDVSEYTESVNWDNAKAAGIDFAITRVGYRGYESGTLVLDSTLYTHLNNAMSAGISSGVYFLSQATTVEEAIAEANFVLVNITGYDISLPIYIDMEERDVADNARFDGQSAIQYTKIALAFCQTIEAAGYEAGIYASESWFNEHILLYPGTYEFWMAKYDLAAPQTELSFTMWQYSCEGELSDAFTAMDMNVRVTANR